MATAWHPIKDWEGLYEVSTNGQVRNTQTGYILKPHIETQYQYLCVDLYRHSKIHHRRLHRIVGETYLGPIPEGLETLHGPGGPHDNRLCNLKYGTHSQNMLDRQRDHTLPKRNAA